MEIKHLGYGLVAASLLAVAILASTPVDRATPAEWQRELDTLRAEVSRLARQVDSLAPRDAVRAETAPQETSELERLRSDVASLQRQVEALRYMERDPAVTASRTGGPEESLVSQDQLADRLDDLLRREPPEGEAERFAAELAPRMRAALPHGASLREVRCRPSLCRIEMTYPDLDTYQRFVEVHLSGSPTGAWSGPALLFATDPELERGDVVATAYLARDERVFAPLQVR
jgi:hypothetical protein